MAVGKVRWSDRYDSLFQYWGQVHEMPWRLLKSQVFSESGFNPDAVSSGGAIGLSQFTGPAVQDWFQGGQKDPRDPEESIRAQARYMAQLKTNVEISASLIGDGATVLAWRLAACSYNCGWGYVKVALKMIQDRGIPLTWESFKETLPKVSLKGRRPIVTECLPYAEKVVPDSSVLAA